VLGLSACGSGDSGNGSGAVEGTAQPIVAKAADFPQPSNRSLRGVIGQMRQGPVLAPSVSVLRPGRDRFAFALFDRGNRQIAGLEVAVYVSKGVDETAHGPFTGRYEPIQVHGKFRSQTTAEDPDAAQSVYVTEVPFNSPGPYLVSAVAKLNGGLVAASPAQVRVTAKSRVPAVGDRAVRVHTPTTASVGGDVKKIDTRIPPDTMHEVDLADALDHHRPIVLLFATPALCQSRVCGPVADVAEQVKSEYQQKVDFIHMEIYKDNDPSKGYRPQVKAWGLETEPFLFAINKRGRVAALLEGAFSVPELQAAVRRALR
jgi:hypothetical protein